MRRNISVLLSFPLCLAAVGCAPETADPQWASVGKTGADTTENTWGQTPVESIGALGRFPQEPADDEWDPFENECIMQGDNALTIHRTTRMMGCNVIVLYRKGHGHFLPLLLNPYGSYGIIGISQFHALQAAQDRHSKFDPCCRM